MQCVVLIPSKMLILQKPIPGYNNVLTIATKGMSFGVNKDLNYNPASLVETFTKNDEKKVTPANLMKNNMSESDEGQVTPTIPPKNNSHYCARFS